MLARRPELLEAETSRPSTYRIRRIILCNTRAQSGTRIFTFTASAPITG